jgi:hypothetical protein
LAFAPRGRPESIGCCRGISANVGAKLQMACGAGKARSSEVGPRPGGFFFRISRRLLWPLAHLRRRGTATSRPLMLDGTAWARSNSADRWSMHQDANRVIVIDLPFGDQGAQAFDLAVGERLALS